SVTSGAFFSKKLTRTPFSALLGQNPFLVVLPATNALSPQAHSMPIRAVERWSRASSGQCRRQGNRRGYALVTQEKAPGGQLPVIHPRCPIQQLKSLGQLDGKPPIVAPSSCGAKSG